MKRNLGVRLWFAVVLCLWMSTGQAEASRSDGDAEAGEAVHTASSTRWRSGSPRHHYGRRYYGSPRFPRRSSIGIYLGPGFGFYGYYGRPYYYPRYFGYRYYPYYPYYYYPYYYVPVAPPVYIERGNPSNPPVDPTQYWYYCDDPAGYYPYVQDCPGGWQPVEPAPDEQVP